MRCDGGGGGEEEDEEVVIAPPKKRQAWLPAFQMPSIDFSPPPPSIPPAYTAALTERYEPSFAQRPVQQRLRGSSLSRSVRAAARALALHWRRLHQQHRVNHRARGGRILRLIIRLHVLVLQVGGVEHGEPAVAVRV